MIQFAIIAFVAVLYAFLRGLRDGNRYESDGNWKQRATMITGAIASVCVTAVLVYWHWPWWMFIPMIACYAFIYWLVFDCWMGWLKAGDILYLGSGKWDTEAKKMFLYTDERRAILMVIFKIVWLCIVIPSYFSLYNDLLR